MDIATLGLRIDSRETKAASDDLRKMGDAGAAAQQRIQQGTANLQREINAHRAQLRDLAAAYRSGAIGEREFIQSHRQLTAATDDLRKAMAAQWIEQDKAAKAAAAQAAAMGTVTGATGRAGVSFNSLRSPLATVAARTLEVNSSMGQLSSIILALGVGTPLATAALAFIAALAAGFRYLTKDTDALNKAFGEQQQKITELIKDWARLGDSQFDATKRGLELQKQQIQTQIRYLEVITLTNKERIPDLIEANKALIAVNEALAKASKKSTEEIHNQALAIDFAARAMAQLTRSADEAIRRQRQGFQLYTKSSLLPAPEAPGIPGLDLDRVNRIAAQAGASTVKLINDSKQVDSEWASIARGALGFASALDDANANILLLLQNAVTLGDELSKAFKKLSEGGKLSAANITGILGAATGVVSLIGGVFGESAQERRSRQIVEENTKALRDMARALTTANLGITGNQFTTARAGTQSLLGNQDQLLKGLFGLDTGNVKAILAGAGTSLGELKDFAKELGITLDTSNAFAFVESLKALNQQMQEIALVRLKDFSGQLDLLNRQFALTNTTDPVQKLVQLLGIIQNPVSGAPGLAAGLARFNLASVGGRSGALDYLLQQLERAKNGQLTTAELGGLTTQQYLDFLSQFGDLLNQANASLKETVDNLTAFANSLKLDQSLTTLSPVQQLVEARRQYQAVLAAAQSGDQTAAAQLPAVARAFLEASRAVNASGPAYAADFARVLAETEAVTKLFAGQADAQDEIVKYTGEMAYNTKTLVEKQDDQIAVLQAGFSQLLVGQTSQQATLDQLLRWSKTTANSLN